MNCRSVALLLLAFALSPAWGVEPGAPAEQAQIAEPTGLPEGVDILPFDQVAPHQGSLAVSPKDKLAAHIRVDGGVVVWDISNYKIKQVITAQELQGDSGNETPQVLRFSPNGEALAVGYSDSRLVVWSLAKQKAMADFAISGDPQNAITALAFSEDGKVLAVGSSDGTIGLWSVTVQNLLHVFDTRYGRNDDSVSLPISVNFSGDRLVVGEWYRNHYGNDRGLLVYTNEKGLMVRNLEFCGEIQLSFGSYADTVAVDSSRDWVVAAVGGPSDSKKGSTLTFSNWNSQKYTIKLPTNDLVQLEPLSKGRALLALALSDNYTSASGDRKASIYHVPIADAFLRTSAPQDWSIEDDSCHRPKDEEKHLSLAYVKPPTVLALTAPAMQDSASPEGASQTPPTGKDEAENPPEKEKTLAQPDIRFTPGDHDAVTAYTIRNGRLAVVYSDSTVRLWQLSQTTSKLPINNIIDLLGRDSLELSADGRFLYFKTEGIDSPNQYLTYNLQSGKLVAVGALLAPFPAHSNRVVMEAARPNHLLVLDLDLEQDIKQDQGSTGTLIYLPRQVAQLIHDEDGYLKPLVAISDDGKLVANALANGRVRVWNIDDRRIVCEVKNGAEVAALAFEADTHLLHVSLKAGASMTFNADTPPATTWIRPDNQ